MTLFLLVQVELAIGQPRTSSPNSTDPLVALTDPLNMVFAEAPLGPGVSVKWAMGTQVPLTGH